MFEFDPVVFLQVFFNSNLAWQECAISNGNVNAKFVAIFIRKSVCLLQWLVSWPGCILAEVPGQVARLVVLGLVLEGPQVENCPVTHQVTTESGFLIEISCGGKPDRQNKRGYC